MSLSDFYEVRVALTLLGKGMYLVFHVRRLSGEFDASDVTNGFLESVLPMLTAATSEDLMVESSYTWNLGDEDDFHFCDITVPGAVIGDCLPVHDACTLKFPRLTRSIGHGFKRIPGLVETFVTDGQLTGDQFDDLKSLGAAIVAPWSDATPAEVCEYVVIKRVFVEETEEQKEHYRLPKTDGELAYYRPLGYVADVYVRTQNTRKIR